MAGTMEGLGVPLFGGYSALQSDGATSYLTVDADGMHNFSWTDEGADNYIDVSITQTDATTSGYTQAFHVTLISSGGITAPAQVNAFAADITLGGLHAGEVSGVYLYFAETGTFTSGHILAGYTVYFTAFASATPPAYRGGVHCYSAEAAGYYGTSLDAGLLVECSGTSGSWGAVVGVMGSTMPDYFLHILSETSEDRMVGLQTMGSIDTSATASLKVLIGSTTYRIPLITDSCG